MRTSQSIRGKGYGRVRVWLLLGVTLSVCLFVTIGCGPSSEGRCGASARSITKLAHFTRWRFRNGFSIPEDVRLQVSR